MSDLVSSGKPEQPIVVLDGVSKKFDDKTILNQFSLTINNGEFLTLLGPSGCGKTTVLRLIAGLEDLDNGKIFLEQKDITHLPAERRAVNTVFQTYALFPHMTVFENVAFGLRMQRRPHEEIRHRVHDILCVVQLEQFAERKPNQLSGGQRQRVALARALVNNPKVLLLDEPFSALDYSLRKRMQNELKALQRRLGLTFIFVTHDQEEALSMSDRIVVMRDGQIEQVGTPREIYEEPKNLFVARFVGEINVFKARILSSDPNLIALEGVTYHAEIEGQVFPIVAKNAFHPGEIVYVLLRPEDLRVEEIADQKNADHGMIGLIKERNYKGMTLDSLVELPSGKTVMVSEFFNEDDPDVDHSLNQLVRITWVSSWEVVLPHEQISS